MLTTTVVSYAQEKADTIYTFNKTIVGNVKEVGAEVLYTLPHNEVVYRINRQFIGSIVFSSGRKEIFRGSKNIGQVKSHRDWGKVELTTNSEDVAGMIKIDWVSVKASGATSLSSVMNTQNRSFRKLKQAAAMLGGEKVFINNQTVEGNILFVRTTRTHLTGTIYRTIEVDTVGLARNIKGAKFNISDKTIMNVDTPQATVSFITEHREFEFPYQNFEFRKGLVYLKVDIGEGGGVKKYIVTFQSSSSIILGHHLDSRFIEVVLKRVKDKK